jgi:hypothetical protein
MTFVTCRGQSVVLLKDLKGLFTQSTTSCRVARHDTTPYAVRRNLISIVAHRYDKNRIDPIFVVRHNLLMEFVTYGICQIWDRCYDFLNIFAEKFSEKIGVFD